MTSQITDASAHTDLLAELPITKEATTSRVLINNPLLRYVLFAFDTNQQLTEHSSPRAVVVNLLSGTMDFTLEGTVHHMVAGDVLYLPPHAPHALVATAPCHMALTMVDPTYQGQAD